MLRLQVKMMRALTVCIICVQSIKYRYICERSYNEKLIKCRERDKLACPQVCRVWQVVGFVTVLADAQFVDTELLARESQLECVEMRAVL